jgi:hypothetical protein
MTQVDNEMIPIELKSALIRSGCANKIFVSPQLPNALLFWRLQLFHDESSHESDETQSGASLFPHYSVAAAEHFMEKV